MNGNEFGGPGWNGRVERGVVPPGFCGARRLVLQGGHGPLMGGLCPGVRLETALGISRGRTVPAFAGMGFLCQKLSAERMAI